MEGRHGKSASTDDSRSLALIDSQSDGSEVPIAAFKDQLMVTVVSAEVEPAAGPGSFPSWGEYEVLANVTQGKPGGCR